MARLQSGAYTDAVADFTALAALRPADPTPLFFRANAKLQAGDAPGAVEDYGLFLAAHPTDTEARMGRALARQFAGDLDGADADLSLVLDALPDAATPRASRGYLRVMRGDFTAAAADLTRAAAFSGAPPEVALWRFIAERRAGLSADGPLRMAAKALASDQWPAPVMHYFLGAIAGDAVLAAAAQEQPGKRQGELQAINGRLCEAYFYLGEAALMQKDTDEAGALFAAAVATGMTRFTEFAGAQIELNRLKNREN
jgi:tetratricopeptide (TPR) repeat protein